MSEHKMKLAEPFYTLVKNNKKTVEARIYDDKRKLLKEGDTIIFLNNDGEKPFKKKIRKLKLFKSFRKAIESAKLKNILPHIRTYDEGVSLYYSFSDKYKKQEKTDGVINIYF